ncbi:MAG: PAS domain-containing protein [Oscillospiraceae bacterium]
MQNDLKQDKSGSFELKFRNQDFFVKYIPLGYNDWFTATVLPMKSIKETVDKYKLDIFCIVAILGILLLFCVMFIVLYYNYKIKAEKEINRKYEMITKNINIGILLTEYNPLEKTLRLKYINDAFTSITGFSEQDILHNFKDDYFNMIYKDDIEKALNSYINQISNGDTYKLKYRLITKENDYICVIDSGRIYRNDDGMIENRNIITPAD